VTDWGKVAAAGSAGAVFPLYLFDKFNIGSLIERASNTPSTATIFAITIFSMLAMLIVGIGIVLAKVDIGENRGATILLSCRLRIGPKNDGRWAWWRALAALEWVEGLCGDTYRKKNSPPGTSYYNLWCCDWDFVSRSPGALQHVRRAGK
jgi:hypothetical protein